MADVKEFTTKDSGVRQDFATGARRDTNSGKGRFDLLPALCITRLAKLYARGATKYEEFNWTKGIPSTRYAESGLRHFFQYMDGDRSEDHLAAVVFNTFGIMFNEEMAERGLRDPALHNLRRWTVPEADQVVPAPVTRALNARELMTAHWANTKSVSTLGPQRPPMPPAVATMYGIVPLDEVRDALVVGCEKIPTTDEALEIRFALNRRVIFDLMTSDAFQARFKKYEQYIDGYIKSRSADQGGSASGSDTPTV